MKTKKTVLVFCLILCLGDVHALSLYVPPYEIPDGMTEHGFAVSYITGKEDNGKTREDMSSEERDLSYSKQKKFHSLGNDVLLSAYSEVLFANMDKPENVKGIVSVLSSIKGLGNDALLSVYSKLLAANPDKPEYAQYVVSAFCNRDAENLASYGNPEILSLVRKSIERGEDIPLGTQVYLALKGGRDEIKLLEEIKVSGEPMESYLKEMKAVLRERVERNFIATEPHFIMYSERGIRPSVANTGPQGVYAYHIIRKACEMQGGDQTKIPDELAKMVITFDTDGNPVCNVDLAKYGLSMPVITPKPDPNTNIPTDEYNVVFPHEAGEAVPAPQDGTREAQPATADVVAEQPAQEVEPPPPQEEPPPDPPQQRRPAALIILALACAALTAVWFLRKRNKR